MNENLEAQAQALFKSWFVDFEPWGGVMPEGWKEGKLSDVTSKITDGVHNTVTDTPNGGYYLLSCKNIIGGKLNIGANERTIDEETFCRLRKRTQLEKGDILLSSVGTVGELLLLQGEPDNIEFQRSVAIIKPKKTLVSSEFLFCSLYANKEIIKQSAHGAVQQCIFLKDINDFVQIIPSYDAVIEFTNMVKPLFEKIYANERESSRLSVLRDTLLPRLMSGDLDVEKITL